jgi:hypothetical protein
MEPDIPSHESISENANNIRKNEIDENVRRAIYCGLYVLEKNLNEVMKELTAPMEMDVLYHTRNDIDPETRQHVLETARTMREQVKRIKEEFRLDSETLSLRRAIYARISEIWAVLLDLRPSALRNYGNIDTANRDLIEGRVKELVAVAESLRASLYPNGGGTHRSR